jgi:outer membrane protein
MTAKLKIAVLAACLFAALSLPAHAQGKIAIIDLRKVFDTYYKTKAATDSLKQRGADLDKEMNVLTAQRQKAAEDYKQALEQAGNMAVSVEERDKRKKVAETKLREIQDLEQSMTQFRAQANSTMEEQERRMRENIIGEIRAVVSAKAKAAGYGLVLDVAGESLSRIPIVVYNSGQTDLTDDVLAQLNANAPAPSFPAKTNK